MKLADRGLRLKDVPHAADRPTSLSRARACHAIRGSGAIEPANAAPTVSRMCNFALCTVAAGKSEKWTSLNFSANRPPISLSKVTIFLFIGFEHVQRVI